MEKKIKIIDLLYKRAKGEEIPKRIRVDHWCYKFEWVEHLENYYDKEAELDLMEVLSMSEEELNYEVEILDEEDEFEDIEEMELSKLLNSYTGKDVIFSDIINQLIKNQKKIIERLKKQDNN